jgi:FtsZ-interacting cell division protein ZipA
MTTSSIVWIVVFVVAAVLLVSAIVWVARKKRTEHRRVQAGDIRDKAVEQSHEVGQREALADETAAKARAAQAEAEAMAAHSAGLQHQAQARRTDAATSRSELNREFERADKIDPDSPTSDTPPSDTARGDAAGRQDPPRMPKAE